MPMERPWGRQPLPGRGHQLGGREVLLGRRSVPMAPPLGTGWQPPADGVN